MKKTMSLALAAVLLMTAGCGYSSRSLLPPDLTSVHVENFDNDIDPTRVSSDRRSSFSYRPGLEVDITRAVIDGFIFDRHLDIKSRKQADLLLEGQLKDFRLSPLSYDGSDNVTEYRAELIVDLQLYNNNTGELMWREAGFMGQANYSIDGPDAKSEAQAINDAVKDLAQRIVERTVEAW
ncbi:MAG: hypothetical protein GF408_08755 [Candidatus Omnitrophica bacterium]|nr:hypothetical protein [Candidatus Omnitrophota bacterium]